MSLQNCVFSYTFEPHQSGDWSLLDLVICTEPTNTIFLEFQLLQEVASKEKQSKTETKSQVIKILFLGVAFYCSG